MFETLIFVLYNNTQEHICYQLNVNNGGILQFFEDGLFIDKVYLNPLSFQAILSSIRTSRY